MAGLGRLKKYLRKELDKVQLKGQINKLQTADIPSAMPVIEGLKSTVAGHFSEAERQWLQKIEAVRSTNMKITSESR